MHTAGSGNLHVSPRDACKQPRRCSQRGRRSRQGRRRTDRPTAFTSDYIACTNAQTTGRGLTAPVLRNPHPPASTLSAANLPVAIPPPDHCAVELWDPARPRTRFPAVARWRVGSSPGRRASFEGHPSALGTHRVGLAWVPGVRALGIRRAVRLAF